jgi:hypothetical protein
VKSGVKSEEVSFFLSSGRDKPEFLSDSFHNSFSFKGNK